MERLDDNLKDYRINYVFDCSMFSAQYSMFDKEITEIKNIVVQYLWPKKRHR